MSERYETTVHRKTDGHPVRGCEGDAIAENERLWETLRAIAHSLDEAEPAARKLPPSVMKGVFYWSRGKAHAALRRYRA